MPKIVLFDVNETLLDVHALQPELTDFWGTLGVGTQDVLLVAAHGWDVFGAMKAGCQAALAKRPGKAVFPLGPRPQFMADNLVELTSQIISNA